MPGAGDRNPWAEAQVLLKEEVDAHTYDNWFSQASFGSYDSGLLTLEVPNRYVGGWIQERYLQKIDDAMRRVQTDYDRVQFRSENAKPSPEEESPAVERPKPTLQKAKVRLQKAYNGFNPRYTFDRFVIGSGNRFAHAAARAVANSPGHAYNPLFMYGDTGLGKTHLMQAVGQELMAHKPDAKCVFISSEHFTNQLIKSIAEKSTQRFRDKYRKVDVLLIDDIHFIAGKEATQEEFFHTFNELFDRHKQIVLSSDRPPKEIQGIEERLVSRFESGLVTDIQPPDLETRVAILQSKAKREHLIVPDDVMRFIATYITTNIRELEGALITVLAYGRLTEQHISLPMVEEVLRDLVGKDKVKQITVEQVQRAVAEHYDVRIADLRGRSRQRQIVRPRQIAMHLCKDLIPRMSLGDIGDAFGGKDHTTVLYSCEQVALKLKADDGLRQTIELLSKNIRA